MEYQAGLPAGILFQPVHIGGALALTPEARPDDVWDQLDVEATAGMPGTLALNQDISNSTFKATTVSQQVLPYNARRTYLMVQNNGAAVVRIAFGRAADLISGFVLSASGGFIEPILGTVSSVYAIAVVGSNQLTILEGFRV